VQHTITIETTLGSSGSMPNSAKGGFNRIAGSYTLPMFGRKIIKGQ